MHSSRQLVDVVLCGFENTNPFAVLAAAARNSAMLVILTFLLRLSHMDTLGINHTEPKREN